MARRRPSVPRLSVCRPDADAGRSEGDRIQRAPRRSRDAGDPAAHRRTAAAIAGRGRDRSLRVSTGADRRRTGSPGSCSRPRLSGVVRIGSADRGDRGGGGHSRGGGLPRGHRAARPSARHRRRAGVDRRRLAVPISRRRWRARTPASFTSGSRACSTAATSGGRRSEIGMKDAVVTFGCRVNQADSLGFEEELLAAGAVAGRAAGRRPRRREQLLGDGERRSRHASDASAASRATTPTPASSSPAAMRRGGRMKSRSCPASSASCPTTTSRG